MDTVNLVISGWVMVALVFFLLWRVAVVRRNAGWVDFGWALTLVLLAGWYAMWTEGFLWRRLFYFLVVAGWGLRLAGHILRRLLHDEYEDPRYRDLRRHWGMSDDRNFFWFFQAQGLVNVILAAPVLLLMHNPRGGLSVADLLGLAVIAGAVYGEAVADRQLQRWRANPANAGRTCREGLWGVSRHPNYFFEWLQWTGWPVLGLALLGTPLAAWWPLTLAGPALMLFLLLRVTGIPHAERQALRSRGDDYRRYQREVSAFFPWFVK